MTDLTMGQRIAECRKQLGLSQEALGEKLGVSRQAISKWEADGAVPEIDKLISLSKLFGVSVGWLLGVEEAKEEEPQSEISEELLRKIEEIVLRYQPQKERMSTKKKVLIGICAGLLVLGAVLFFREWGITLSQVDYLASQTVNNQNQNAQIFHQLNELEDHMNNMSVQPDAATSEAILQSYSIQTALDGDSDAAEVSITAIPGTWHEDITASISVRRDGAQVTSQTCGWDGSAYVSKLMLSVGDGYQYWLVTDHPDGTKEQTRLYDTAAENLATTYTIGCRITHGTANFDMTQNLMHLRDYEFQITNPNIERNPNISWKRAELVVYHIRGGNHSVADTYTLFKPTELDESRSDGALSDWYSTTCYPNGPFQLPEMEEGDGLELWVMLEMSNGISNNQLVTSWAYVNGEFIGSQPVEEANLGQ